MEKLTIMEVNNIVNEEGIGYAVFYSIRSDNIEDEQLAELWKNASAAIAKVDYYLLSYGGDYENATT